MIGGDAVVLMGDAFVDETAPRPDSRFIEKYRDAIAKFGETPDRLDAIANHRPAYQCNHFTPS